MTAPEDMTLDRLRRTVRRGGAKLAQRMRKRDLPRCGARCRSKGGRPCVAPVVVKHLLDPRGRLLTLIGKRCRLHGGLSTGPRTAEGRRRCVEAGRKGAEERRRRQRDKEWWCW